jgi:hypothetical protein
MNKEEKIKLFGKYLIDNAEKISQEFEKKETSKTVPDISKFIGNKYMEFSMKNENASFKKKMNLNEFRTLIKQIIKEESEKYNYLIYNLEGPDGVGDSTDEYKVLIEVPNYELKDYFKNKQITFGHLAEIIDYIINPYNDDGHNFNEPTENINFNSLELKLLKDLVNKFIDKSNQRTYYEKSEDSSVFRVRIVKTNYQPLP